MEELKVIDSPRADAVEEDKKAEFTSTKLVNTLLPRLGNAIKNQTVILVKRISMKISKESLQTLLEQKPDIIPKETNKKDTVKLTP